MQAKGMGNRCWAVGCWLLAKSNQNAADFADSRVSKIKKSLILENPCKSVAFFIQRELLAF